MRMYWICLAVVALAPTLVYAETPDLSANHSTGPVLARVRQFAGQNWWTRYGEPVNATALAEQPKGEAAPELAGPLPLHGDGYIYGPGACECEPPCIWHLWAGYWQNPKRCHLGQGHRHGCGHCGACDACGACDVCGTTQAACGCGDACGPFAHLKHKWKGMISHLHRRCDTCAPAIDCGCATPVIDVPPSEKQAAKVPVPLPEDAAVIELPRIN